MSEGPNSNITVNDDCDDLTSSAITNAVLEGDSGTFKLIDNATNPDFSKLKLTTNVNGDYTTYPTEVTIIVQLIPQALPGMVRAVLLQKISIYFIRNQMEKRISGQFILLIILIFLMVQV